MNAGKGAVFGARAIDDHRNKVAGTSTNQRRPRVQSGGFLEISESGMFPQNNLKQYILEMRLFSGGKYAELVDLDRLAADNTRFIIRLLILALDPISLR